MTTKQKLEAARSTIAAVENDLLDPTTGEWKKQPDFSDDVQLAADIENVFKANGGVVSQDVDKVLAGVGAVVKILGV